MKESLAPCDFTIGQMDEATVSAPPHPRAGRISSNNEATLSLFVYGIIDYGDLAETRGWRTAFCRRWDGGRQSFFLVGDTDYEYED
jgi:hypothetical protein